MKCGNCTLIVDPTQTLYRSVSGRRARDTAIKQVCLLCVEELSGKSLGMQDVPMMALALFMQQRITEKKFLRIFTPNERRGRPNNRAKHRTAA